MSSSLMPERALEHQRLEHRGVEPAVGLGLARQRGVGDRRVRSVSSRGVGAVVVADAGRGPSARRLELVGAGSALQSRSSASLQRGARVVVEAVTSRCVGKTVRPGSCSATRHISTWSASGVAGSCAYTRAVS